MLNEPTDKLFNWAQFIAAMSFFSSTKCLHNIVQEQGMKRIWMKRGLVLPWHLKGLLKPKG